MLAFLSSAVDLKQSGPTFVYLVMNVENPSSSLRADEMALLYQFHHVLFTNGDNLVRGIHTEFKCLVIYYRVRLPKRTTPA